MPIQAVTPILNVSSVEASIAWFAKMGWREGFTWKDEGSDIVSFGSVCSGKGKQAAEIFLCLDGQGSRGTIMPSVPGDDRTDGVWMSWWVDTPAEVDALHASAVRQGLIVTYPPTDEPWGVREFHLRHPDGHMFRVSCGHGR
jgi:catechol 2,3-dioxygenase-like lactoylglutathione lyase family enzyme